MHASLSVADCPTFGALVSIFFSHCNQIAARLLASTFGRKTTTTADNEAKGVFTWENA